MVQATAAGLQGIGLSVAAEIFGVDLRLAPAQNLPPNVEQTVLKLACLVGHHSDFCCVLLTKDEHMLFAGLDEAARIACDLGPSAFHELRAHHRGSLF